MNWRRCVRNRHWCCDVADNTQHRVIKGCELRASHARLIRHVYTHAKHGQRHRGVLLLIKIIFVFVCSPVSRLLRLASKNLPLVIQVYSLIRRKLLYEGGGRRRRRRRRRGRSHCQGAVICKTLCCACVEAAGTASLPP